MSDIIFELNQRTANRFSSDWLQYQQWWQRRGHRVEIDINNKVPDNILRITQDIKVVNLDLRTKTAVESVKF